MTSDSATPTGPDLRQGIALGDLPDSGMLAGHAGGEAVLLVRRGEDFFAVGAVCTHYGGPLAEGLVVGETVRCPWHHACFSLRTGEALRAPALNPVSCFRADDGALPPKSQVRARSFICGPRNLWRRGRQGGSGSL